jgi:hypothetical protein
MPIIGKTPDEALERFGRHVNALLLATITKEQLSPLTVQGKGMQLAFRDSVGKPRAVRLGSARYGPLGLYLGHVCDTVQEAKNKHRLRSVRYNYTISVWANTEPFVRWEYVKYPQPPTATFARHHIQGPMNLSIGQRAVKLNKLHLPSGWVTVEDVIRFCINDLRVRARTASWHRRLEDSYTMFRTEFVGPMEP